MGKCVSNRIMPILPRSGNSSLLFGIMSLCEHEYPEYKPRGYTVVFGCGLQDRYQPLARLYHRIRQSAHAGPGFGSCEPPWNYTLPSDNHRYRLKSRYIQRRLARDLADRRLYTARITP